METSNYSSTLNLQQLISSIHNGSVDIEELISYICNRIDTVEPQLHTLIDEPNRRERLLNEARELKKKYPNSSLFPPLFGIPIGVKDIFHAEGFETRAGSQLPASLLRGDEASVVTKLRNAGALVLGKTVTTEFAYFQSGPTRNPWNIEHTPGGSSSGSAAAVAAGLSPLALGTQTIGSIIRPASYCGVYGFKPSRGRIAIDGIIPFSPTMDQVGYFCQDIEGVELIAEIIVDGWEKARGISDSIITVGIPSDEYLKQAESETLKWFEEKIDNLRDINLKIVRTPFLNNISIVNQAHRTIVAYEFARVHSCWFKEHESLYSDHSKNLVIEGMSIEESAYIEAFNTRANLQEEATNFKNNERIDLWLSPSSQNVAPKGLHSTGSPIMNLPWTFLGFPTISVPDIKTLNLPLGLQLVAFEGCDEHLIKLSCGIIKKMG